MTLSFASTVADHKDYLPPAPHDRSIDPTANAVPHRRASAELSGEVERIAQFIAYRGFVFEPWQVAAFVTATRTKPFVILAGISGTGKTQLPRLVAEATGSTCITVPVRPDWTDSSELLGFERLDGSFSPGPLLRTAREAIDNPNKQYFFVLDEMNIARVEYYLAEVLSHLENRRPDATGRVMSEPLIPHISALQEKAWTQVCLPDNLCLVGSVNMDETTFGFSKKVLDRAFVIEFSQVDLAIISPSDDQPVRPQDWTSAQWRPPARSLSTHPGRNSDEVASLIETLIQVNTILEQGQLQFGYRVRDEIVMFCLAANSCPDMFTTSMAGTVDPLDLAIGMKVLPRVQGGGPTIWRVLEDLQRWASPTIDAHFAEATYPFCSERLELMVGRLRVAGFTNFWL